VNGNVLIGVGSNLNLQDANKTTIGGNLIIVDGASISVNTNTTTIQINDCGIFNGDLIVNISKEDLPSLNNTEKDLFNASCYVGTFGHVQIVYGDTVNATCEQVTATTKQNSSSLAVVFRYNNACTNPDAFGINPDGSLQPGILATIIVFAVIVVLLLVFFVLSLVVTPLRRRVYPHQFAQRFESTIVERHRAQSVSANRGSAGELDLAEPAHSQTRDPTRAPSRSKSQSRLQDLNAMKAQDQASKRYMAKVSRASVRLDDIAPQGPTEEATGTPSQSADHTQ